ncbi:transporter [Staphylococcus pseudintermedius]|nr:transporter [Staphylococcus pseudintermedius]EGQ4120392.1 transporter [Staphylococcus pseudintermedius]
MAAELLFASATFLWRPALISFFFILVFFSIISISRAIRLALLLTT